MRTTPLILVAKKPHKKGSRQDNHRGGRDIRVEVDYIGIGATVTVSKGEIFACTGINRIVISQRCRNDLPRMIKRKTKHQHEREAYYTPLSPLISHDSDFPGDKHFTRFSLHNRLVRYLRKFGFFHTANPEIPSLGQSKMAPTS